MTDGDQLMWILMGFDVSRPPQEFDAVERVADSTLPLTLDTFDPSVVQPFAFKVTVVVSALPPVSVRGGEKVSEPVMCEQVTPPVATVAEVGLELELQPVANAATKLSPSTDGTLNR